MRSCGACGYSNINQSASHCPRCGEALGADGGAGAVAGGSRDAPIVLESSDEVEEFETTTAKEEGEQEKERFKFVTCGWVPDPVHVENIIRDHKTAQKEKKEKPEISGWLILPCILLYLGAFGSIFSPFITIYEAYNLISGPAFYHSMSTYSYAILTVITDIILSIAFIYVAVCFAIRLTKTPVYIVRLYWGVFICRLLYTIFSVAPDLDANLNTQDLALSALIDLLFAIFYTVAFPRSKRAKATFVN